MGLVEAHSGVQIVLRLKTIRFNLESCSSDCPPQGNAGSNLGSVWMPWREDVVGLFQV